MAFLTIHTPEGSPYDFPIESVEIIIGRLPGCDLILDDRAVSRRHLKIYREGGVWVAEDMNSSHGSFLNSNPMKSKATLREGDELRVGKCRLIFRRGRLADSAAGFDLPAGLSLANAKPHRLDIMNAIIELLTPLPSPEMLREKAMIFIATELAPERIVWAEINDNMKLEVLAVRDKDGPADALWYGHEEELALQTVQSDRVQRKQKPPTLCLPISDNDRTLGALYLDSPGRDKPYSDPETWLGIIACRLFGSLLTASREKLKIVRENRGFNKMLRMGVTLAGRSEEMERLRHSIMEVSESSQPLLIVGEKGVGREETARAIHAFSMRDAFIAVDCGYTPIGSGVHAFYGAEDDDALDDPIRRLGFLEAAGGGTLYLGDIHKLDRAAQAGLLKAMQERHSSSLSGEYNPMNTLIIASSDQNLEELCEKGKFRRDLYDRFANRIIYVPPLKDRISDIDTLLKIATGGRIKKLSQRLRQAIKDHNFSGNIDELNEIARQALLIVPDEAEDFEIELAMEDILLGRVENAASILKLSQTEREHIIEVLNRCGWNSEKAISELNEARKNIPPKRATPPKLPSQRASSGGAPGKNLKKEEE